MGNRREKHQKSSRSQLKSKNPRNEPDEVKNREKRREREMRRARSRSEDVNLNAVQLRSLTPPLDQMPGNLAIVRRVSVSNSSASSSKGSPSGSQSDSESESSSNADRRECTFKSKSAKSMGSSRRCVQRGLFSFQLQPTFKNSLFLTIFLKDFFETFKYGC